MHWSDTFPVLCTPRLSLVEILPGDAAHMFTLFTDPRVTAHYVVVPLEEEKDILPVIERFRMQYGMQQSIRWGIVLKDSQEFIGTIGFQNISKSKASVVYALSPRYWGYGYAAEALAVIMQFGFEDLGFSLIEAEVMPGNVASEQVLLRSGFYHERLLIGGLLWDGKHYDMKIYAAVR